MQINLKSFFTERNLKYKSPLGIIGKIYYWTIYFTIGIIPFKEKFIFFNEFPFNYQSLILLNFLNKNLGLTIEKGHIFPHLHSGLYSFISRGRKNGCILDGYSLSLDKNEALSKSIGEFLERYSTSFMEDFEKKLIKKITLSVLKKEIKLHTDFHITENVHLQEKGNDENIFFETLLVDDLVKNKKCDYPVQSFFWYEQRKLGEPKLAGANTNGCAAGFSIEEASKNALLELIERDTFLLYWLTKLSPKKMILPTGFLFDFAKTIAQLKLLGYEVDFLYLENDLRIPVVLSVIKYKKTGGILLATSADFDIHRAIKKSFLELLSLLSEEYEETIIASFKGKDKDQIIKSKQDINQRERIVLWRDGIFSGEEKFLYEGEQVELEKIDSDPKWDFSLLVNELKARGFNIYRYVYKRDYLEKIGYCVVRVVVPQLLPIYLYESEKFVESQRIREFLKKRGLAECKVLNNVPHPFP